ncbi:hypothetical protein [Anaerosacchariphilus polymeriproducens]|uniref:Uncharacterized protein n=1 Tax=Anaerosacchariphilus polymeriproducens TaxID=1812858 RepID=A0A371AXL9_9FIRM|nr:hypothetical protein [Anaerosacchariphilus polymeriproducens]RDU24230.1 hypothetical protein DWV06_05905 [Anaerosacchariphilus polymeriproducens]
MMEELKNISITGRIGYGIMCLEEYLLTKYPNKDWSFILEKYWQITSLELWDIWMDEVIEIIPEYLFEFDDYESSDFEHLSYENYLKLKEIYKGVGDDANIILKKVYDLANSHAYSSIVGEGKESLEVLDDVIKYLVNNEVILPNIEKVKKFTIDKNNGWGVSYNGKILSKILK